jgi:hypothetical protein
MTSTTTDDSLTIATFSHAAYLNVLLGPSPQFGHKNGAS